MQLSTACRNATGDAVIVQVAAGGFLRIYTGAIPANLGVAASGTLLSQHTLATPFAPATVGGVISPTLPANTNAIASGTAGYWRAYKADGTTAVLQGTSGTVGTDMTLNTADLAVGGPVQVVSWTITMGGA